MKAVHHDVAFLFSSSTGAVAAVIHSEYTEVFDEDVR